jgi:hypothetical protein
MAYKSKFTIPGPENGVPSIDDMTSDERCRLRPIAEFLAVLDDNAAHPEAFEQYLEEAAVLLRVQGGMAEWLEEFVAPKWRL